MKNLFVNNLATAQGDVRSNRFSLGSDARRALCALTALAAVAVFAPLGLAQSTLTATVPFAFGIDSHTVLPAGTYVIGRSGNRWQFRSQETQHVVFLAGVPQTSKDSDPSRLVFECRGSRCALRAIQPGHGELGNYVAPRRLSRTDSLELSQVVSVPLGRAEGN